MTLGQLTKHFSKLLKNYSTTPQLDVELILQYVLNKDKTWLYLNSQKTIPKGKLARIQKLVAKRKRHYPIAYLIRKKEFYGQEFQVSPATLIPRPESELLVDLVLATINNIPSKQKTWVFDIATGSGCIIAAIASQASRLRRLFFAASDISAPALRIARKNLKALSLQSKITLHQANLAAVLRKKLTAKPRTSRVKYLPDNIIITANLPYLSKEEYASGSPEITWEPREALFAPDNGLKFIKQLLDQLKKIKQNQPELNLFIFLEISPSQQKLLEKFLKAEQFWNANFKFKFKKDLSGKIRVLTFSPSTVSIS